MVVAASPPAPTYSALAQKAAASGAPACSSGGCPACVKAGLPILLVRPGLAEKTYAQGKQDAARPLLDMHTAPVALSFGRYAARTLRAGFVMVFYAHPHTAEIKAAHGWQAYRVSDGGYLSPYPLAAIPYSGGQVAPGFTCQRSEAYANAMLLVIPEAKRAGTVWVGYSDHAWSKPVRDSYAKSEALRNQRMTRIDAPSAKCGRAMPLTTANLLNLVADYDAGTPENGLLRTPYPALKMAKDAVGKAGIRPESALSVFQAAERLIAASNGKYGIGQAQIVSVPDPVGVTAEAASARLTQCDSARRWLLQQKDGPWKLQTALTIEGLLKEIDQRGTAKKGRMAKAASLQGKPITRSEFDRQKKAGTIPPEASYVGKMVYAGKASYADPVNGTINLPSARDIDRENNNLKDDVLDKLSGKGGSHPFRDYLKQYQNRAKADAELLKKVELDHKAWMTSAPRKLVTAHDCDTGERIDGLHYACIVAQITQGGPMTQSGLEWYQPLLASDPHDIEALLTRALLGNQVSFFDAFKATKNHKEAKNLFKLFEETAALPQGSALSADQRLIKSFPFFSQTVASLPAIKTLAAAVGHPLIATSGAVALMLEQQKKLGAPLRAAVERLMQGIVATTGPVGVVAQAIELRIGQAVQYWEATGKALRRGAQQAADQAAKQVSSKVKNLAVAGSISLALDGHFGAAEKVVSVWVFTKESAARIEGAAAKGAAAAQRTAAQLNQLGQDTAAVLRGGAASFSAAGGILQALSLAKAWKVLETGTDEERRAAKFGLLGAGLGATGAALEVSEAFAKQLAMKTGAKWLKVGAGSLSALALVVDATFAAVNGLDRRSADDTDAAIAYAFQTGFFLGAAAAGGIVAVQAAGYGAGAGTAALGLSWTGWGLILIGLGLAAGYIAMLLRDTPTEEWAAKCIWGDASEKSKWGNQQREQEELNKLLLGIRIELEYGMNTMATIGASQMRSPYSGLFGNDPLKGQSGLFKEAVLRVWVPKVLRDKLDWQVDLYLDTDKGPTTRVYGLGRSGNRTLKAGSIQGIEVPQKEEKDDLTIITVDADGMRYRQAHATIHIKEAAGAGEFIVDQTLKAA